MTTLISNFDQVDLFSAQLVPWDTKVLIKFTHACS